jgi:predicted DNA-binding transcriptional regulator AlpA
MSHIFGPDIRLRFNGASVEYDLSAANLNDVAGHVTTLRIGIAVQADPSPASKPLDLVGTSEIKKMMGVGRQRVHQLTSTSGFPTPAASLDCGKVWLKSEVQEWIEMNRPARPKPVNER